MNRPLLASPLVAGVLALAASIGLYRSSAAQQLLPPEGGAVPPPAERAAAPEEGPGEVLTRGPVHEAFAEPVPFDPKSGVMVPKQPPAAIEELPPEQKPEGDNVAWISGYWTWDDERKDYVWVSGIYRVVPPNRQWMPGYWNKVDSGYQRVPGFWNAAKADVEYFPAPPKSLEVGPSSESPSVDHLWVPGYWTWRETRYAWRPGYWTPAQVGWVWVPSHYVWTPHGYVFIAGYWDVPFERRGLLFAPVYFDPLVIVRPRFYYRPSVVISVDVLSSHLFCRPAYSCYCFGDYYAASYVEVGIYPWFSFHAGHYGYCPIYAYSYWQHAHDHDPHWHVDLRVAYELRRDHIEARPPRTFIAQQTVINNIHNTTIVNNGVNVHQMTLARPLSQVAAAHENGLRLEHIDQQQQERLRDQARDVRRFQEERGRLEAAGNGLPNRNGGPTRLQMNSPVAARSTTTTTGSGNGPSGQGGSTNSNGSTTQNGGNNQGGHHDDFRSGNARQGGNSSSSGNPSNGNTRSNGPMPGGAPMSKVNNNFSPPGGNGPPGGNNPPGGPPGANGPGGNGPGGNGPGGNGPGGNGPGGPQGPRKKGQAKSQGAVRRLQ